LTKTPAGKAGKGRQGLGVARIATGKNQQQLLLPNKAPKKGATFTAAILFFLFFFTAVCFCS